MNVSREALLGLLLGGTLMVPVWGENCLMYMYDPARTGYTEEELPADLALHWKFTTGEDERHSAPPVTFGDTVFYCANGVIYALDAHTGGIQWRFPKEVEEEEEEKTPAGGGAGRMMPGGRGGGGMGMGAGGMGERLRGNQAEENWGNQAWGLWGNRGGGALAGCST